MVLTIADRENVLNDITREAARYFIVSQVAAITGNLLTLYFPAIAMAMDIISSLCGIVVFWAICKRGRNNQNMGDLLLYEVFFTMLSWRTYGVQLPV